MFLEELVIDLISGQRVVLRRGYSNIYWSVNFKQATPTVVSLGTEGVSIAQEFGLFARSQSRQVRSHNLESVGKCGQELINKQCLLGYQGKGHSCLDLVGTVKEFIDRTRAQAFLPRVQKGFCILGLANQRLENNTPPPPSGPTVELNGVNPDYAVVCGTI